MINKIQHIPVLLDEVIGFLLPKYHGIYVDATIGAGGHAEKILEKSSPNGRLIGIDIDPEMLEIARERLSEFGERCLLVEGNYIELKDILSKNGINKVDGILFDLGVSSEHLRDPARGFSFTKDGPLDMRFSPETRITAGEIINRWKPQDLIEILYKYGEERHTRRIVKFIAEKRKKKRINTTIELADLVVRAIGGKKIGKIHPATKAFQALRIAVNSELDNIKTALPIAIDILKPSGRLCVVTFHSLEDRIVKNIFRDLAGSKIRLITKKPVIPGREELIENPRARSAKLRVIERLYG